MAEQAKYSIYTAPGDGQKTNWDFNFAGAANTQGYISRDHIFVYRTNRVTNDIVTLTPEWVGPNTLRIVPAVPATDDLTIKRITPKIAPLVDYTSGSLLNERNLDSSNRQAIYAVAELVDAADSKGDGSLTESVAFQALNAATAASGSVTSLVGSLSASTGAAIMGYITSALGGFRRSVQAKLSDIVSIKDFGGTGGPLEDGRAVDTAATAKGILDRVPIIGSTMFKIGRMGMKLWRGTYGIKDPACVLSVSNVVDGDEPVTQVVGLAKNSDIWAYADRDHVSAIFYTRMRSSIVTTANTTFTATSVSSPAFAAAIAAGLIKYDMLIDTGENPKKTGFIQSVNSSTNTITVDAWYVTGQEGVTGVPAANTLVNVNPMTKAWCINANIEIPPDSDSTSAAGMELGVVNNKSDGVGYGYDVVSLGTFRAGQGFQCRGNWIEGMHIYVGTKFGVVVNDATDIGAYITGGPVGIQLDGQLGVALRVKNAANAIEVMDASNSMLTLLDGGGRWTRFKGKYGVFGNGQTIDDATFVAVCTGTTANFPAPGGRNAERLLFVKNVNAAACTVAGPTFGGGGGDVIAPGKCIQYISDGGSWMAISQY